MTITGSDLAAPSEEMPFLPAATLPKGGGAIRGIGEKLSVKSAKGTCSFTVPVRVSPGRGGAAPELTLVYDSGTGNSPFGVGWTVVVPRIARKTEKGLPLYSDSDTFMLAGTEDLTPALIASEHGWTADAYDEIINNAPHRVERFRPRVEGAFTRVERCRDINSGEVCWRTVTGENVVSWYGRGPATRIADPGDPLRVFEWLLEEVRDDRGNVIVYEYKSETTAGVDTAAVSEGHRLTGAAPVNRYLKYVHYGNRSPGTGDDGWLFLAVLDYGEHDPVAPTPDDNPLWPVRVDPFSTYRPGFEVRTWRLCRRILMFHDFPQDALGPGPLPRLVCSTDLSHEPDHAGTRLVGVGWTSYLWDQAAGTYSTESLPPVEFEYTRAQADDEVREAPLDSPGNLPVGVDGQAYQFVDLDGDGVPGVLAQQGGSLFYQRNLGKARFAAVARLPVRPSITGGGTMTLTDLDGDGRRALVRSDALLNGYQDREPDDGWGPFTPFALAPGVDWTDPALYRIDLDGDGLGDLLLADGSVFRWHRSLGRAGYAAEQRIIQPDGGKDGPVLLRADATCAVLLADMSGDGLTDLVRVRDNEVCYWPNLGHGWFGAMVRMADPPLFDHPGAFDPARLRPADIDGSGPTDLVYLGRGEVRFWLNRSGNGFGPAQRVAAFPDVDRLDSVQVVDLLGTGTSCLVWSSPLPRDAGRRLRYLDLSRGVTDPLAAGHKPNLLCLVRNSFGGETRIGYAPSTVFSLMDEAAGRPWATRLPFPVHVVQRVEHHDHVAKTRVVSTYSYRHGYYDGPEREFRGFGMVEQRDAETFPGERGAGLFDAPAPTELHRPPVRTRTWFHTGAFLDEHRIATLFRDEYYTGDPDATPLPDSELPSGLTAREAREARRALAGKPLRTEVYADDGTAAAPHPYTVTEHRYRVRRVHPGQGDDHAVFLTHQLETVNYHYERNPADPRVGHELTLTVDEYGSMTQAATVSYPRRAPEDPEQTHGAVVWTINRVANSTVPGRYRLGVPVETYVYEVTDLPATSTRHTHTDLAEALAEIAAKVAEDVPGWELAYENPPTTPADHARRRLIDHTRTTYWDDTLTGALPHGSAGIRALVRETYRMAFTPGLLAEVYEDRVDDAMIADETGHMFADDVWWLPSGVRHYDPASFYLPSHAVDPFGNTSSVDYDEFHLLVTASHATHTAPYDVLVTSAEHDYRLLTPWRVTDPNGNQTRAAFDVLGRVVATWVTGKDGSADGDPDGLPGAVFSYDAWSWRNDQGPAWAHSETRERHGDPDSPWQRTRAWTDGWGRVAMTKTQAEPGLAWTLAPEGQPTQVDTTPEVRWVGNGRTVFDNKGTPVKRYEPYFSIACAFEDEAALVEQGVTPVLHHDPLGRLVRTEYPDGTRSRVEVTAWRQTTWDRNDTVLGSRWHTDRGAPDAGEPEPADPARRAAWLAADHAGTPAETRTDPLGRAFLAVADAGPLGEFITRTKFDIEGNVRTVTDARGVPVLTQKVDLLGRVLHTVNRDAGERWTLPDVAGQPVRSWDAPGLAVRHTYDPLRRPVGLWVQLPGEVERLAELTVYGETHPDALDRNLLGRPHLAFDEAGLVTTLQHDFKGNPLSVRRALAMDYESTPDWSALADLPLPDIETTAATLLEPESFTTTTGYDALNRLTSQMLPDTTEVIPVYNEAGLLESVLARLRDDQVATPFVTGIAYDAKGQRTQVDYGNGTSTLHTYDPLTHRLTRLETLRGNEHLQDLSYVHDPEGNIVEIRDDAQQTVFFANQVVTPATRYAYDALYRLISAQGREHATLGPQPDAGEPTFKPLPHPNDTQALRVYTEDYTYDAAGNILTMAHHAGPGGSWTRRYEYAEDSNRLLAHSKPSDPDGTCSLTFTHDPHGNMTVMPHLPGITWDFADRMAAVDLGGGGTARYTYDGGGQRVRKVVERPGGLIEEHIYLGDHEIHRRRHGATVDFERHTVHIADGTRPIALVETKTVADGAALDPPETRIRYQFDNHLGSSSLELDENAAVISYEEYHPYGTTSLWLGAPGIEVSDRRYRYTGKEKDEETGLYNHGARYYACWLGRWTAADPAGITAGPNGYAYVHNNPVKYMDPTGGEPTYTSTVRVGFPTNYVGRAAASGTPIQFPAGGVGRAAASAAGRPIAFPANYVGRLAALGAPKPVGLPANYLGSAAARTPAAPPARLAGPPAAPQAPAPPLLPRPTPVPAPPPDMPPERPFSLTPEVRLDKATREGPAVAFEGSVSVAGVKAIEFGGRVWPGEKGIRVAAQSAHTSLLLSYEAEGRYDVSTGALAMSGTFELRAPPFGGSGEITVRNNALSFNLMYFGPQLWRFGLVPGIDPLGATRPANIGAALGDAPDVFQQQAAQAQRSFEPWQTATFAMPVSLGLTYFTGEIPFSNPKNITVTAVSVGAGFGGVNIFQPNPPPMLPIIGTVLEKTLYANTPLSTSPGQYGIYVGGSVLVRF